MVYALYRKLCTCDGNFPHSPSAILPLRLLNTSIICQRSSTKSPLEKRFAAFSPPMIREDCPVSIHLYTLNALTEFLVPFIFQLLDVEWDKEIFLENQLVDLLMIHKEHREIPNPGHHQYLSARQCFTGQWLFTWCFCNNLPLIARHRNSASDTD
ncbi:hypothetical protein T02_14562 [Trichinella nativa]|uniref:Uncharacterized protein n=1 Tax=Trichinella nativa TaxID=6335 RepID=A0A0V1KWC6_9BILA|nr:hypothetical protein T02_14562 [Trichinella nativa]